MGAMKNFAMDMEEEFFGGAQDIVHEFWSYKEFVTKMMEYRDQVSHLSDQYIMECLAEMYYG